MTLASPIYLLLLLLIPLGFAVAQLGRRRRRKFAIRLPTASTLAAVLPRESRWAKVLPGLFLSVAAAALAFALAKPQVTVAVPVEKASVMLVIDASGSMEADDVSPTRLDAAKQAVSDFLSKVPKQMQVGVMAYSDQVEAVQAPTTDRQLVKDATAQIQAGGGTATGDALTAALQRLRTNQTTTNRTPAAILLLSDGATTAGVDPTGVAETAKQQDVPISTVALGTANGTVTLGPGFTRAVPPDPETLSQIAQLSGGKAFTASDSSTLSSVYKQMGSKLGTRPVKREATAGFAGAAAVFLALAMAATLRRRDRLT
ncbi:MAG: VWA domain-containing protein [Solirubrobacteraceae bacterium]|nr:VWA domain-containing protein [Patulibacter sp.]